MRAEGWNIRVGEPCRIQSPPEHVSAAPDVHECTPSRLVPFPLIELALLAERQREQSFKSAAPHHHPKRGPEHGVVALETALRQQTLREPVTPLVPEHACCLAQIVTEPGETDVTISRSYTQKDQHVGMGQPAKGGFLQLEK